LRGSPPTHYHSLSSGSSSTTTTDDSGDESEERVSEPVNMMNEDQFARLIREIQAGNAELATAINAGGGEGRHEREGDRNNAPFTLKPYGEVLNTTNKRDAELYNQAIKPFETKYDGNEGTFYNFLNKIKQRAGHLMCNDIYEVEQEGVRMNLFADYTTVETHQAQQQARTRWTTNNWKKQASYIMGMATLDSLEDEFRARLLTYQSDYTIEDNGVACADGPLVLKQITRLVQPETGYSGYSLISELHALKLSNYGYDLPKVHEAMKNLVLRIRATKDGRESINDTMLRYILLDIYESARCEDFKTFIQTKKDTRLPELIELMQQSEDKYRDLVKSGKWSETPKDELILALQAKTEQLTKENKALAKTKRKRKDKKEKKKSSKKDKRRKVSRKGDNQNIDWMTTPPKPGKEDEIITQQGKEWAWCKFHNKWVVYKSKFGIHTSKTCRLNPNNKQEGEKKKGDGSAKVTVDAHQANSETDSGTDDSSSTSESSGDERSL